MPSLTPNVISVFALSCLALGITFSVTEAQESDPASKTDAEKPKDDAKPESGDESSSKQSESAKKPLPVFTTRSEIISHFEPLRGEIQTKFEELSGKPSDEDTSKLFDQLRNQLKQIDLRHLKALQEYTERLPQAEDLGPARYDIVDLYARMGKWQETFDAADVFLRKHGTLNTDLTRQASYFRADALFQLPGKEAEAANALERIISAYPTSMEARFARANLYRTYLWLDKTVEAQRLWRSVLAGDEVQSNPDELAWINTQLKNLNAVGETFPALTWIKTDESTIGNKAAFDGATLVWYWQTTSTYCLEELKLLEKVLEDAPNGLKTYAVCVNKDSSVWKQFVRQENHKGIRHVYEGFSGDTLPWRTLGVTAVPTTILVNGQGKVFRVDVPIRDLSRTLDHWLKTAEERKAGDD